MPLNTLKEQLTQNLSKWLPVNPSAAKTEVEEHIREWVNAALSRLNVVSREEFDSQMVVLQHTRAKLDAMEVRLNEIEAQLELSQSRKK